jgi:succinoglycan biosynthesis transport protein ExoP
MDESRRHAAGNGVHRAQQRDMNLETFIAAMRARIGAFLTVLFVTVLGAAVVSMVMPKSYRATASVIADVKDEQSFSNVLRPLGSPQERQGYLQTQVDVINSPKVAQAVVQDLKLAEDPKAREEFEKKGRGGTIEEWLSESLLQSLKVETSQSSIVRISFVSRDSEFAARAANAFAKAYLGTLLELRVEPTRQAATWFNDQLKGLRTNLQHAQSRLTE